LRGSKAKVNFPDDECCAPVPQAVHDAAAKRARVLSDDSDSGLSTPYASSDE